MSKIRFKNRAGITLIGDLELPPGGTCRATALFAHCFTCGRDLRAARDITRSLAMEGFAVLRFDFTGIGESEGDFADTHFSSNLDDLEDAAGWLAAQHQPPQLLIGHSLGGTAAIAVAERLASIRAIATIGAPASPDNVLKHFDDALDEIEAAGCAEVELAGRPFRIRKDFVDDARSHDLPTRLRNLRRALLILHSPLDDIVPIKHAESIFTAALHPKSFVSLDKADHLLSKPGDAAYAAQTIAAWAGPFISAKSAPPTSAVVIRGRTADQFVCRVDAGRHTFTADEPSSSGGNDSGPDPYALLAAALGSCTVMTLNMYARRKKLDVDRVTCHVEHRKIHAEDCAECESTAGKIDSFHRTITIEGELEPPQRQRMLEIAERCPVHRTLESKILIRSSLGS